MSAGIYNIHAQGVSVSPGGGAPDPSAGLDINFVDKGVLIPRLTTVQREAIQSPAEGLMIFNTTTKCFEAYVLNDWNIISCPGCVVPIAPDIVTGPNAACPGEQGLTYSINAVPNADSYNWTVPSGATITAGQGTTSITVDFGSTSGAVSVSAVSNCGTSAPAGLIVGVNPASPAAPGVITGNSSVCANSSGNTYSIAAVTDATTYTWSVPVGASITDGQGTTSIIVAFGNTSGNVSVTAGNVCGTSSTSGLSVTLNGGGGGSQTFDVTSSVETLTIPPCVYSITIDAYGAQGGNSGNCPARSGGKGARISGTFSVTPGDQLSIVVGAQGSNFQTIGGGYTAGSGGGGSYVWNSSIGNTLLIAAGGGGGTSCLGDGAPGSDTTSPTASANSASGGSGGTGGSGGSGQTCGAAGGGAGWFGSGGNGGGSGCGGNGKGGTNPLAGAAGGDGYAFGATGGYGGGGSSASGAGGGGGGYNGGGGGNNPDFPGGGAGGGAGSYNGGTNQTNAAGFQAGNGSVIISW
ncbi:MAG: hypothetical protein IT223_02355 [Crocinitomicaceae bacterium]|nr:hypothetical protein [Crocinitomicaceae bacterium]